MSAGLFVLLAFLSIYFPWQPWHCAIRYLKESRMRMTE
jgi:hypothetical protein